MQEVWVLHYDEAKTSLLCYPAGKANTTFSIPETVTDVGTYAFVGSSSLTEISIRNGVISIESPRTIVDLSAWVASGQWEIVTPGFTVVGDQKELLFRAVWAVLPARTCRASASVDRALM